MLPKDAIIKNTYAMISNRYTKPTMLNIFPAFARLWLPPSKIPGYVFSLISALFESIKPGIAKTGNITIEQIPKIKPMRA